jgi:hypothetical protein
MITLQPDTTCNTASRQVQHSGEAGIPTFMTHRTISYTSSDRVLNPRSTFIFEKLTVAKQLKIFQAFNGTPNVHSRVHNSPPLDPIRNQINLIQTSTHFLQKGKGKGKFHPKTGHEVTDGGYRYISVPSLTSALDGWVNTMPRQLYPLE